MTKVTMPRAVGYVTRDTSQADMDAELPEGTPIITTTQAEAYANARVREALEQAAGIIKANAEACDSGTRIMLRANAEAVLAIIPSTPA